MACYLVDTHVFIWLDSNPAKLSKHALSLLEDPTNEIVVSTVSLWEMQIKAQLGKLKFGVSLSEMIESQIAANAIRILEIKLEHIIRLEGLPFHHKDPFDRMLIAQALCEKIVLISHDAVFHRYLSDTLW